jgi:mono/diheme cytochrome c family protein
MKKTIARSVVMGFSLLALATLAACGGGDEAKPAEATPPAAEATPAPEPTPEPAPAETTDAAPAPDAAAAGGGTPFACIAGNADAGKVKYAQLCASCHGLAGAGDGVASAGLNPKPAHHNDGAYMNALTNEHLAKVIAEGGVAVGKSPMMAPWGAALGPQGVLDVAAFVRTLADPPYACPAE